MFTHLKMTFIALQAWVSYSSDFPKVKTSLQSSSKSSIVTVKTVHKMVNMTAVLSLTLCMRGCRDDRSDFVDFQCVGCILYNDLNKRIVTVPGHGRNEAAFLHANSSAATHTDNWLPGNPCAALSLSWSYWISWGIPDRAVWLERLFLK